jgi:hypothetical protein
MRRLWLGDLRIEILITGQEGTGCLELRRSDFHLLDVSITG